MARLNQAYFQEGKIINGSPEGVVSGETGNTIYDIENGDTYESLGGTKWRLTKKNNVPMIDRSVETFDDLLILPDYQKGEHIFIKDRSVGYVVKEVSPQDAIVMKTLTSVGRRDALRTATFNNKLGVPSTDVGSFIFRYTMMMPSGNPITDDVSFNKVGSVRFAEAPNTGSIHSYGWRNRSGVFSIHYSQGATSGEEPQLVLDHVRNKDGNNLDASNLPFDTYVTAQIRVPLSIANMITVFRIGPYYNLEHVLITRLEVEHPNEDIEIFDLRDKDATGITGTFGTKLEYYSEGAASPALTPEYINSAINYDGLFNIEVDNLAYALLDIQPLKANTLTLENIGGKSFTSNNNFDDPVSDLLEKIINSNYNVDLLGGGFYYLDKTVEIKRSKDITLKSGNEVSSASSSVQENKSATVFFTDKDIILFRIFSGSVNFIGGLIDLSSVANPTQKAVFSFCYRDRLIADCNIKTQISGSESITKEYNKGFVGVDFDTWTIAEERTYKDGGEIHFCNFDFVMGYSHTAFRGSNNPEYSGFVTTVLTALTGVTSTIQLDIPTEYDLITANIVKTGFEIAIYSDAGNLLILRANRSSSTLTLVGYDGNVLAHDFTSDPVSIGGTVKLANSRSNNSHNINIVSAGNKKAVELKGYCSVGTITGYHQSRGVLSYEERDYYNYDISSGFNYTDVFNWDMNKPPSIVTNYYNFNDIVSPGSYTGISPSWVASNSNLINASANLGVESTVAGVGTAYIDITGIPIGSDIAASFELWVDSKIPTNGYIEFIGVEGTPKVYAKDANGRLEFRGVTTDSIVTLKLYTNDLANAQIGDLIYFNNLYFGLHDDLSFSTRKGILNKASYNSLGPNSIAGYRAGAVTELVPFKNTDLLADNTDDIIIDDSFQTNKGSSFISQIHDVWFKAVERGVDISYKTYLLDADFNWSTKRRRLDSYGVAENSLASIASFNNLFNYTSVDSNKTQVVYDPSFDSDLGVVEIYMDTTYDDLTNKLYKIWLASPSGNLPKYMQLIAEYDETVDTIATRSQTYNFTTGGIGSKSLFQFASSLSNRTHRIIIRLVGSTGTGPFYIARLYALTKYFEHFRRPMISVYGGQKIYGDLEVNRLINAIDLPSLLSGNNISDLKATTNYLASHLYLLSGRTPANHNIDPSFANCALAYNNADSITNLGDPGIAITRSSIYDPETGKYYYRLEYTTADQAYRYSSLTLYTYTEGTTYQIEFEAKVNVGNTYGKVLIDNTGVIISVLNTEWTKYTKTIVAGASKPEIRMLPQYGQSDVAGRQIDIRNMTVLIVQDTDITVGDNFELNYETGRAYNLNAASSGTVITTSNKVLMGKAIGLINTASVAPSVTGGVYRSSKGDAWVANTDMYINVRTLNGVAVEYWFEIK